MSLSNKIPDTRGVKPSRVIRRRAFLGSVLFVPALAACGFQPLYGPNTSAEQLSGRVAVSLIDGEMGFAARKRLTERIGATTAATHRLDVTLSVESDGLAISQTNQITRYNLTGTADFKVVGLQTGATVESGTSRAFAAYSAAASPFATRVAEEDARARLAVSLADQIVIRIAATSDRWLK